jgi:hypothetical protein
VIDGLWTVDPANPNARVDQSSGLAYSVLTLPAIERRITPLDAPKNSLRFSFRGPPDEIITVAGSFNGWDPFMYRLAETAPGVYSITIFLPPGTYQYVFFHRGERLLDPNNARRVYTREGKAASEIEMP